MPLVQPIKERSLSFRELVRNFFISPLMTNKLKSETNYTKHSTTEDPEDLFPDSSETSEASAQKTPTKTKQKKSFGSYFTGSTFVLFKSAVIETLPFDGLDLSTNTFTTTNGDIYKYKSENLPLSIVLTSLFAIPNRPDSATDDGEPQLSLWNAVKNLWGNWKPLYTISTPEQVAAVTNADTDSDFGDELSSEPTTVKDWKPLNAKTILQIAPGLIVKFLIILPLKLLTWLPKTLLNVAKIVAQTLPLFIANVSAAKIGTLAFEIQEKWNAPLTDFSKRTTTRVRSTDITKGKKFTYIGARVLLIGLLGLVHYTTRIAYLVIRTITSPHESARQAFYAGRGLKITTVSGDKQEEWTKTSQVFGFILGSASALVSLALSATFWAILLPLTLGALTSFIPQLIPLVNSFAALPFIAHSITYITGTFGTIGVLVSNTVAAVFAPAISALATLIPGLTMSTQVIALGATLGLLLAPLASILNRIADLSSNTWNAWNPPENTLSFAVKQEIGLDLGDCCVPSTKYKRVGEQGSELIEKASLAANINSTGSGSNFSVPPKNITAEQNLTAHTSSTTYGGRNE